MEDIEDLLIGGGGAPPGYRLPITAVGVKPKKKNKLKSNPNANDSSNELSRTQNPLVPKIPGTQVSLFMPPCIALNISFSACLFVRFPHFFLYLLRILITFYFDVIWQTIYVKTFGCSHNQVSPSPPRIKLNFFKNYFLGLNAGLRLYFRWSLFVVWQTLSPIRGWLLISFYPCNLLCSVTGFYYSFWIPYMFRLLWVLSKNFKWRKLIRIKAFNAMW